MIRLHDLQRKFFADLGEDIPELLACALVAPVETSPDGNHLYADEAETILGECAFIGQNMRAQRRCTGGRCRRRA